MQLALGIEYHGAAFHGYQQQRDHSSVQESLQQALSQVADHPVILHAAGRTDSGVHATGQVVAFRTAADRPLQGWLRGGNSLTPSALGINWVEQVDEQFHPRYSAASRRYQYLFYESAEPSPLLDPFAVRSSELDDESMHRAAQLLLGERDFTTFRGAGCQSISPFRRLDRISVHRAGSVVFIDVQANAFLLHMVRNIAGALWQIGQGRRDKSWLETILAAQNRALAGPTAAPQGLYLVQVHYPDYPFPTPQLPGLLRALGSLDRFS